MTCHVHQHILDRTLLREHKLSIYKFTGVFKIMNQILKFKINTFKKK